LGIGLSVGIALLVTWFGLGLAYYTNYSVGFYVSSLGFAVYLVARLRRQFARRPGSSIQPAEVLS
jgi:zinc/manganese transport system permease protein